MASIGPTKAELESMLDEVSAVLDDALDPELTREEVIAKIKEAQATISGDDEEDEDGDDQGDGE